MLQPKARERLVDQALDTMALANGGREALLDVDDCVLEDAGVDAVSEAGADGGVFEGEVADAVAAEGEDGAGEHGGGDEVVCVEGGVPVGESGEVETFFAEGRLELVQVLTVPREEGPVEVDSGRGGLVDYDEVVVARLGGGVGGLEFAGEDHEASDGEEEAGCRRREVS